LLDNILSALGTFSFSGDSFVTYNLPGRPIFDPVASLFFYGGIALCVSRWRKPAYAFVMMWLVAGMLPSLVLGEWTSTLHSKAAEAPILALPALFAVKVGRVVTARLGRSWARLFSAGCVAWLIVIASSAAYDYFIRWGEAPETRAAYFHNLTSATDYLSDTEHAGFVALSSPFPDLPLDPFIADMRLRRNDLALRWFDARRAIVFPDTSRSLLVVPPNAALASYFAERLDVRLVERVQLRPDDVDPYFDVFEWNPVTALSHFQMSSVETVTAGDMSLRPPVNFGGAVELLAYDLLTPAAAPGETVALATVWRILDPDALGPVPARDFGRAAVIFAHALAADDVIVGQEDRLDAPAWNWHPGDTFVQLHQLQIDGGASPGFYRLEVGVYTRADEARLPVLTNGIAVDDRVLLQSVEVVGQ